MNEGAKGEILTNSKIPQILTYSFTYFSYSSRNYKNIKRIFIDEKRGFYEI